jgi:hypothetical protein
MTDISEKDLEAEDRRIRRGRLLTDLTLALIQTQHGLTLDRAYLMVDSLRRRLSRLFPGREGVFDLVVRPRLERAIRCRFRIH